jgi:hypothetical protein
MKKGLREDKRKGLWASATELKKEDEEGMMWVSLELGLAILCVGTRAGVE